MPDTLLKFGKLAAARPFGLQTLPNYVQGKLPAPPKQAHYGGLISPASLIRMDGNGPDSDVTNQGPDFQGCGDCTIAEKDHALAVANAILSVLLKKPVDELKRPTPNEVVSEYFVETGGQDTGLVIANTLQKWAGPGLWGTKIGGYAPINFQNMVEVHQGVAFYGLVEIGIAVQQAQMDQFNAGQMWVWEPDSPVLGGHDVCIVGYDETGVWVLTWAKIQKVSYQFLANAMDEAWAVLMPEFRLATEGPLIDWDSLDTDINNLNK